MDMARPAGTFRVEAAGSLTPELEGRGKSASHPRRDRGPGGKKTASKRRDDDERG